MEKTKVTIENPCHIKWGELTKLQNSSDRHCQECSLNIKDFTKMNNEEIIRYLASNKEEKICCAMKIIDKNTILPKVSNRFSNWYKKNNSSLVESFLKSLFLFCLGASLFNTSCKNDDDIVIGLPAQNCKNELRPDTTTPEPNDSIMVEICD